MNHFFKGILFAGIGSLFHCATMDAVPAYPKLITTTQPDNTTVQIYLRGDEHTHWGESPEGYTLLRNSSNYWTFARQTKEGDLVASSICYKGNNISEATANGIQPGLKFSTSQLLKRRQAKAASNAALQIDGTFPSKGKRKLLLLLINYADTKTTFTQEDFNACMNQENYQNIGSFRDFYKEASYGQLDIETTVTPWVTLSGNKDSYGTNGAVAMIVEALQQIDNDIDLKEFDNDGDGILDGLAVIHQGAGQEYTGGYSDIWSHSSTISGYSFDGIQLNRYTIEPETLGTTNTISTIGVICHEFGHNLGAPDFYDTDYANSGGDYGGTGAWDLMGGGAWNGNSGDRPAGMNMWQKIMLGWAEPTLLSETQSIAGMKSADIAPEAFKINTTVGGEYFILENRQQSGAFDIALPGHGLIIYHIDENRIRTTITSNTLNATHPQAAYTVCANAGCDPSNAPSDYGDLTTDGAPFPGSSNQTSFSDYTLPSAKSTNGRFSYFSLNDINDSDGTVSFGYVKEDAPEGPQNLTAEANNGIVTLKWQHPSEGEQPIYYTIYCNGETLEEEVRGTEYTDTDVLQSYLVTYEVDATYADGMISPYNSVSIHVPANKAEKLSIETSDEGIVLQWDADKELTRMLNDDYSEYSVTSIATSALDYAHRYTADDLLIYQGATISRVGFLPFQSPSEVTYQIRIWEANADGTNPQIVSDRAVKEFGTAVWRDLALTKPVTIKTGKEYWIGIRCESTTGLVKLATDSGPILDGRGNKTMTADGEWENSELATGNFYISATLSLPKSTAEEELPTVADEYDPMVDLLYPIGFRVYRDNELIGSTRGRYFVDYEAPAGTHTYTVSSLYKGDNESSGISEEVEVMGAVETLDSPTAKIIATPNGLRIENAEQITVANAAGIIVYHTDNAAGSRSITLPAGAYIVTTGNNGTTNACKRIVR